MKNLELLFEYNNYSHVKQAKKNLYFHKRNNIYWEYRHTKDRFDGQCINDLIMSVNYIMKVDTQRFPLYINLGKVEFSDKLVYILLECICYYLIFVNKRNVHVNMSAKKYIYSDGIQYSPLNNTNDIKKFYDSFYIDKTKKHFRKLINYTAMKNSFLSNYVSDIYDFFYEFGLEEDTIEILNDAISEVAGNALEHGNSDCLIDIDITDEEFKKRGDEQSFFYGINVVVLNFSHKWFGEKLKNRLDNDTELNDRYKTVLKAKDNHSNFFDKKYTESMFYTIASFQHKISGSLEKKQYGGVGLTQLIKSIEEKSDGNICYMLNEDRMLYFKKELLLPDDRKFIGFNKEADFVNRIPDYTIFSKCYTYFPGTAYNLNFAIKKEEISNG